MAFALLETRARDGEQAAAQMLGTMVEMAEVPRDLRLQAAGVLTEVGDPHHQIW